MKVLSSSIKARLQLSFITIILLSTIGGYLSYNILSNIVAHEDLKSKIGQMVSLFAEARKQEKDFILYERKDIAFLEKGKCESLQKHHQVLLEMKQLISSIKASDQLEDTEEIFSKVENIYEAIRIYEATFFQLVNSYRIRGFKDHGLEGAMREVVHQLQKCESKEEQWFALMLRRHEKDFFIRQDKKYMETLHKRAEEFKAFVTASTLPHMSPDYKETTIVSINNYVRHFNRIAGIEQKIGLNKKDGYIGELTRQADLTEPLLASVQQKISDKTRDLAGNSLLVLVVSGLLMLICGICFSLLLAKIISKPIIQLSKVVEKASIGDQITIQALEAMKRNDELGKLVNSFGNMFAEINLRVKEISEKNTSLQQAAQKEKERNWLKEGVSLFEGIMAKQAHNIELLCDEVLLNLVKYTGSSQAVLFLKQVDEKGKMVMQVQSCYSMDKKRYINRQSSLGEGLVGAVWQEKEPVYMNDIPESYSKIRSGLGQAKPTAIFIVPAVLDGEVEAVVEMGAFREYSSNERELILQVCKGLASAVSRVRMQERTQMLLAQANALTEELRQNEEEMRQQMEELQATKEGQERVY